jgi:hypothetical protein
MTVGNQVSLRSKSVIGSNISAVPRLDIAKQNSDVMVNHTLE